MSPASKSKTKSKDKTLVKSAKEQQNASIKPSGSTNIASGNPVNAYNPISGTFHELETPSGAAFPPLHDNGRFRNIDEPEEHSSSPHGTLSEYDSVSNNGSCSGESEDMKEKAISTRLETVPGLDSDKREKIRLKNEKKHQRQREKRAQELHERCSGYLRSRKLEKLSEQLVAMGFSHERATLALMLNEGRVEKSVNWLFEGSEEEAQRKDSKLGSGGSLKIDISEELAQISAMEMRYKCSKQEVERVVVACEGDLVKAEETLHAQKQELPTTPPRPEYTADTNNPRRLHEKSLPTASVTAQHRMNEQDFNNKTAIPVPTYSEPGSRNLQPQNQPKSLADKRWGTTGSSPAFSSSMALSMQVAPPSTKTDVRLGLAGNEGKNLQQIVREPVIMMQRPQSINGKQNTVPSASATPVTSGWYLNNVSGVENMRSNVKLPPNPSTRNLGLVNQSSEQFYHPVSRKENPFLFSGPATSNRQGGTRSPSFTVPSQLQGSYGKTTASLPSLAAPSSLGLFTGWGSAGTLGSSHVDWNTGSLMPEFDYTSIDWTLNSNLLSSKSNGLWMDLSSLLRNTSITRGSSTNSSFLSGLRGSGMAKETSSSAGSSEWTSPFAGKDMFSLPRQFATSPYP
ncbi:hypothetical protein OIU77_022424 [Salix suchowensis]|uniref:UBA domain-containing protein n=1 Tax=Salix suchowensis TaxID=1278906 RepID=A0ABQ9C076_9ROSI|nr:hypothetical protein OIU77_022424 [Salix suchowensis]